MSTRRETFHCYRIAIALLAAVMPLAAIAAPAAAVAQDPTQVDAVWEPVAQSDAVFGLDPDDAIVSAGFGTSDVDIATISWMRFFPITSSDGYGLGGSGTVARHSVGPDTRLWAEIGSGEVPNGALITQIVFYVRDNHVSNITGTLCVFHVESNGGTGYAAACPSSGITSGTPGETVIVLNMSETVQRRYFDGTVFRVASYGLVFSPDVATNQNDIRMVRVVWRRQVTPAPASATFDDVPTSHPFFQYIEALADSGITSGCGGGNYCPGNPVTRGQMARFLATALGLHWPAF